MKKGRVLSLILAITLISFSLIIPVNAATNYYVSTLGDDLNNGTSDSTPFKTIQKAASVAQAGDTVYIMGGTYRETVTPAYSGTSSAKIRFVNYDSNPVIVSGCDQITGWAQESGNVYYAPMTWNLNDKNQIFASNIMKEEARWPNQSGTLLQPTLATCGSGSDATHIVDTNLTGSTDYWKDATLWIVGGSTSNGEWIASTSTITAYDATTHTLTFNALSAGSGSAYNPTAGNKYYLSGIKSSLDTDGEWWYDSINSRLYSYSSSGVPSGIEAKRRLTAFDLAGKSYIEINGINVFGATINTNAGTTGCLMKSMKCSYISHSDLNTIAGEQKNLGINLNGTGNEINSCELEYSSCSLITVKGLNNNVINCYIHDGGYVPSWDAIVNLKGKNCLISNNTICDAGRACVTIAQSTSSDPVKYGANQIQYNDIYNCGRLTKDMGLIYAYNVDGQNTEIHHNKMHDNIAGTKGTGLYTDNYSSNFIMHHNVLWNCGSGVSLNTPNNYNLIYNNTVWNGTLKIDGGGNGSFGKDFYGDRIFNNITKYIGGEADIQGLTENGYNITSNSDPGFADISNNDYHLTQNSSAVDAGVVENGITDGYSGNAPDCGAYEYSGTDWTAGHNFQSPPSPTYTSSTAIHRNLGINGGFENGDLTSWTKTDAQNAIVINESHWNQAENVGASRTQFYGLRLGGTTAVDGLQQTIAGLTSNTTYIVGGWLRSPNGETAELSVSGYGGSTVTKSSTSSTWTFVTITFKTGSSSTSAIVSFKKTSSGANYIYCDDMGLRLASVLFQNGFENAFTGWTTFYGTSTTAAQPVHSGSYSYYPDEDQDVIGVNLGASHNKVVSVWFYDDATDTSEKDQASVGYTSGTCTYLGVASDINASNYIYKYGSTYATTTIKRTTGWHQFVFDYRSGTDVKLYIDGQQVATCTGVSTAFNAISMGDWWKDDRIAAVYFDDVLLTDYLPFAPCLFQDGFENGLLASSTFYGTPTLSTQVKHSGNYSFTPDENQDVIAFRLSYSGRKFNKAVSVWFYDDATDSSVIDMAGVGDTAGTSTYLGVATSINATNYIYRYGSTSVATTLNRSTGWHQFVFNYLSGTDVKLYIDGTLVATCTTVSTSFDSIPMGDWWQDNKTASVFFDDIKVMDSMPF